MLSSGLCGKEEALPPVTGLTLTVHRSSARLPICQPSHTVLLVLSQSVIQNNCFISVSYPSSSKVKSCTNLVTLETKITLFKRGELGQETFKTKNESLPFSVNYAIS